MKAILIITLLLGTIPACSFPASERARVKSELRNKRNQVLALINDFEQKSRKYNYYLTPETIHTIEFAKIRLSKLENSDAWKNLDGFFKRTRRQARGKLRADLFRDELFFRTMQGLVDQHIRRLPQPYRRRR